MAEIKFLWQSVLKYFPFLEFKAFKGIRSFYTCKSRRRPPPRLIRVERPPIPLRKGPLIRNEVGHSAKKPNEIVKIFFVN